MSGEIKAILFDLDNTLIDFFKIKEYCIRAAATAMVNAGLDLPEKKVVDEITDLYWKHGWEDQRVFQKYLKSKHVDSFLLYPVLSAGIVAYRKTKSSYIVPYPRVKKTLIVLKERGLKLGIVSDAPRIQAWIRLTELGLVDFFDFVVAKEDTGRLKPHASPFKKALKKLGLLAEKVMFVGDNPDRDILGAKKIGMKTCLARYGQIKQTRGKEKADFELKKFDDLLKKV
ncbi:HAD-IA family hydrolase [Candidatus Micrarchaeota archaeon]|nr:HAD-IA family hydrolase [Candidatus Micrarchaeota archaeon]